jgi:hypothetical protein
VSMSRRRRPCVHAGVFHQVGQVEETGGHGSLVGEGTCSVAEELTDGPGGAALELMLD